MAFNYPDPANGNIWKTWMIGLVAAIKTFLGSIPGTAIAVGTVPLDRLEKQKAIHRTTCCRTGDMGALAASTGGIFGGKTPQADGAVSTKWKLVSYSIYARATTPRANNDIVILKGTTFAGAAAIQTISIAALAAQTPIQGNLTSETSFSTDDMWFINYTYAAVPGAPVYTDLVIELFWEQDHVSA